MAIYSEDDATLKDNDHGSSWTHQQRHIKSLEKYI
jgi:hypothetical protein